MSIFTPFYRHLRILLTFLAALVAAHGVHGQLNISGTVPANFYTPVTNLPPCVNSIDVADASGFAVGDRVLIVQMQGLTIDQTNAASYGNVLTYGGSGLWEKAIIDRISGNTVFFTKDLVNRASYDVTGKIQMVKVYFSSTDVNVTGTLRPLDWNGTVGGIVAIEATNNLNLTAGIDVSGNGFRGAANTQFCPNNCNFSQVNGNFFYASGDYRGSLKGEGAAAVIVGKELGRGAQANGGGGGNDHNNGGAGGGNASAGGQGGNNAEPGGLNCKGNNSFGVGGKPLNYGTTRMWMGGGGGAGHGNNSGAINCQTGGNSGFGGDGGGMVFLKANTLNGGGQTISANGSNGQTANFDGGGGGGAGGVVFIDAPNHGGTLTVSARGGTGGSSSAGTGNRCYGPGGGGSGGVVVTNTLLPASVTTTLTGGAPGLVTLSSNACNNTPTTGQTGAAGVTITGISTIAGTVDPGPGCVLPVEMLYFDGHAASLSVNLNWATSQEANSSHFEVLRAFDGIDFVEIGRISAAFNSSSKTEYQFEDIRPFRGVMHYKLRQVDMDGQAIETYVVRVLYEPQGTLVRGVYPNPVPGGEILKVEWMESVAGVVDFLLMDATGREVWSTESNRSEVDLFTSLDLSGVKQGLYFLQVKSSGLFEVYRVVVGPAR